MLSFYCLLILLQILDMQKMQIVSDLGNYAGNPFDFLMFKIAYVMEKLT